MSREIKFRAWDGKRTQYFYSDAYGIDNFFMRHVDDALERWSGVYDTNGKDIYEGDILKAPRIVCIQLAGQVRFWRGSFEALFDGKDEKGWPLSGFHPDDLRVIGNIHENADLLEKAP